MSSQFSINAVAGKVKYWKPGYWGFKLETWLLGIQINLAVDAGLQGIERSRASREKASGEINCRARDDLSSAALLIAGAHTLVAELVKKRGRHMCVSLNKWKWTESLL